MQQAAVRFRAATYRSGRHKRRPPVARLGGEIGRAIEIPCATLDEVA